MERKLPNNIEKVESLFTWLLKILNDHSDHQDIVKFVSQQKLLGSTATSTRRSTDRDDDTKSADKDKDDDNFDPDDEITNLHPQNSNYADVLSIELVRSCKAAFLGNYEESRKHLKKVQGAFVCLTGDHDRLLRVFQYCIETMEWCIVKLERQDVNEDVSNGDVRIAPFRKEWEDLQRNDRDQAVIIYLKVRLENNLLRNDRNRRVEVHTEILDLDPDYYIWWTIGYQDLRLSRRQYKRHQNRIKAPCVDEILYCDKAYDLAPHTLLCTYNKATMLKDVIFVMQDVSSFIFSEPHSPLYDMGVPEVRTMCLESLHNAEHLAAQYGLRQRSVQIFLQKVDLLINDDQNGDNRLEGLRLLEEAIQVDPSNAHIHLKLGKVYQHGLGPNRDRRNLNKARFYYEQAMERNVEARDLCTFTCIQSYIKLLPHLPRPLPVEEALQLLTSHLPSIRSDLQRGIVTMWQGFLQWHSSSTETPDSEEPTNKRSACMEWLDVLGVFNEKQKLLGSLQNIFLDFSRCFDKQQFIEELQAELIKIREEISQGLLSGGYVKIVDRFLQEVHVWHGYMVRSEQQHRQRGGGGGGGQSYRQPPARHVPRGSGTSRTFRPSLADQSDNWRLN